MANPPIPRRSAKAKPGPGTTATTDTAAPRRESRTADDGPPPPPGPPPSAKPSAARGGSRPQLLKSLEELFSAPAYVYALNGDEWAENHINEHAPRLADAWFKLAQKNPAVKRTLERLTTGSAWGGVAVATGVTVLPLLSHHGVALGPLDAFFAGVPKTGTQTRGPIVPPPPGRPPGPGGGGTPTPPPAPKSGPMVPPVSPGMTPPVAQGAPPGVVTVASTNNRAVMVDG